MKRNHRKIIQDVAKECKVPSLAVEAIITTYLDNLMQEVVNNGEVKIPNLLSISSKDFGETTIGDNYVPPSNRLTARISNNLRQLRKIKISQLSNYNIKANEWREILSHYRTNKPKTKQTNEENFIDSMIDNYFDDED